MLLTRAYPAGAPQYAFETPYDGSETGIVETASTQRRPSGERSAQQLAYGCTGDNTADGRLDGHVLLSSTVRCIGSVAVKSVTFFVFDKDPNVPNAFRTYREFVLRCNGGPACRTAQADYPVVHTQVAKIVTYFDTTYGRSTDGELTMPYNERGILYPIVRPFGYGGSAAKEVPWPAPPCFPCSTRLPANSNCQDSDYRFRPSVIQMYIDARWPIVTNHDGKVPSDWDVHHIKPRSWGGSNQSDNGVLLPKLDHIRFNTWWESFVQHGVRIPVRGSD